MTEPTLPIEQALPALLAALESGSAAVLQAPPGAGKTTRVPLALLERAGWLGGGRIVMLEPRRIAARAAAERMARTLGQPVGATVGYRIRDEARVSGATRIEVVTEGILTRRLQSDPSLEGVAAVLFDEFHERSIHADLGLALCLETQAALRPELRLLVMSATLDGEAVARLMGGIAPAPIVTSEGRSYPVETRWLETPETLGPRRRLEEAAAELTLRAMAESEGDALLFLPGAREIRGAAARLESRLGPAVELRPLHGELALAEQRAALSPASPGKRKLVLATAIAETSLTIDGVRVVVDAGRARRARFDPGSGMSRLVTERVSRAAADQRRGRAGRTAPGVCWRMWTKGEEGGLALYDPPEITIADLTGLALELAEWGAGPEAPRFLDPPPEIGLRRARELLAELGALDARGGVTEHGKRLAAAPLHPRLAHMALEAGATDAALLLAALLEERDPLRGAGVDLTDRLKAAAAPARHAAARPALERIAAGAGRLRRRLRAAPPAEPLSPGAMVALAYPDRIAQRRDGQAPRFLLSGGKGAFLDEADPLAGAPFLAVADLDGDQREARIRLAAPITRSEIESSAAERICVVEICEWSRRERRVLARSRRMLGALVLEDRPSRAAAPEALAAALIEGVRDLGLSALPWTDAARRLRARVGFARAEASKSPSPLPDVSDDALTATLERWLAPHLIGLRGAADLAGLDLASILGQALGHDGRLTLDRLCPARFTAPTGTGAPIDYSGDAPRAAIRLQELFGVDRHPTVAGRPLVLELLSPAGRPIQTTADLPGFWRGSYADVAKDMRARYPKHPWPADPLTATPTRRAKPRG